MQAGACHGRQVAQSCVILCCPTQTIMRAVLHDAVPCRAVPGRAAKAAMGKWLRPVAMAVLHNETGRHFKTAVHLKAQRPQHCQQAGSVLELDQCWTPNKI